MQNNQWANGTVNTSPWEQSLQTIFFLNERALQRDKIGEFKDSRKDWSLKQSK